MEGLHCLHVLNHEQAELVTRLIVQVHFNFHPFSVSEGLNVPKRHQTHMLAESIVSQLFQRKQVESHSLHVRRGINAIRPVALRKYQVSVDVLHWKTSKSHFPIRKEQLLRQSNRLQDM